MAQDSLLGSPDATAMSPLRLTDIWTPEAGMPPMRLSDIMTPGAEAQATTDDGTPVDSGHEVSPPSTAIAGLVGPIPDSAPGEDSETTRQLKQEVRELNEENRLLRQKLNLLQTNSKLKQVALIGTVISWFGDKGLLGDDMDAVYELTSMMMSARATDERAIPAFADQSNAATDDVPRRLQTNNDMEFAVKFNKDESSRFLTPASNVRRTDNDDTSDRHIQGLDGSFNPPFSSSKKEMKYPITLKSNYEHSKFQTPDSNPGQSINDDTSKWPSPNLDGSFHPPFSSTKKAMRHQVTPKSGDEDSKFQSPESNARLRENEDTYQWPSQSSNGSFNPPFSSSKKDMEHPVALQGDVTLLTEGPRQLIDNRSVPTTPVGSNLQRAEVNTDSFDESTGRLDTRIQRMEKAVKALSGQHAEMRSRMTRTRQNAAKRFRIWKAIAASRRLAALNSLQDEDEAVDDLMIMREQSVTPTPLTQYPFHSAEETGIARVVDGSTNKTILGEIAFQTERRILAFVFQRREILYGYNLGNLEIMIRTHPDQDCRSVLLRRYELLMDVLRGYGWLRGRHAQFVADTIARHGIFQDVESAQAEALKRGWSNPSELKRGVLCLCPVVEVLDMLVILDCLLHMARNDGLPVFLF
ncbi:uncharacterized protein LOC119727300 [Patiria miniata]|uniref:Speriolin C-terminal domain-containing protein n=1 Tax=Patiria miniata TaxID=46514 RepID=A0A913ZUY9_PATMI|nr:uncharacterized protein LOC119727300 [Patiria miniata]